ncbi:hypothetical protein LV779_19945 [Streptomyces thinghirensis]|nr:hypothetical protein [Streptomyces thinghirensis]
MRTAPGAAPRRLRARPRREDPRRSVLERCLDCRHVFRNPVTPGPEHPLVRAGVRLRHGLAARAVLRRRPDPESWLDVGTGDADFPRAARAALPVHLLRRPGPHPPGPARPRGRARRGGVRRPADGPAHRGPAARPATTW